MAQTYRERSRKVSFLIIRSLPPRREIRERSKREKGGDFRYNALKARSDDVSGAPFNPLVSGADEQEAMGTKTIYRPRHPGARCRHREWTEPALRNGEER